jgi:predicted nucleic acid-binding protein
MTVEFVDTNVLMYAQNTGAGLKHRQAIELVTRLAEESTAAISIQVLIEFYSVAIKRLRIGSTDAEAVIRDWTSWMTIHRPDSWDVVRAAGLQRQFQISWWDALILNSALELGCTTLWTEDFNHGQRYSTLTARNPFA